MKLGYNRAGRPMDQLEAAGIVVPTREVSEVLIKTEIDLGTAFASLDRLIC